MEKDLKLRVKTILKERGMTSKDLAEKMGVTPQQVSSIVNGGKSLSLNALIKVAGVLDVSVADLIERDDEEIRCPHCGERIKVSVSK